jgi:alpha-beta hydrolase superfamily lysophospholipase
MHVVLIVFVVLLLLILFIALVGWFASSSLQVRTSRPPAMLRVLAVTKETVTLPRQAKTAAHGLAGLVWQGDSAVVGEILESSQQTVTRRIVKATRLPSVGVLVRWNKFVYQGDPQNTLGLAYEEVQIPGPLGNLPAWFVPGKRGTWVLLVHGRRAPREESLRVLPALAGMGFPALFMTYRNDAGAPESPDHLYHLGDTEWEDVEAGVRYALSHGAQNIVLFGWSMGGCLVETFLHRSSYVAHVRAVVLDSPILNWQRVLDAQVRSLHLPRWFVPVIKWMVTRRVSIHFAALNYERPTGEISTPTLLFHGTADALVPVVSSDLYAQARPNLVSYLRVEGADHTLVWNADPQAYEDALITFLHRVFLPEMPLR